MKAYIFLLVFVTANFSFAQDLTLTRKMVDTLTSTSFWGRGYTKDGMHKAAAFLADQFQSYGLQPVNGRSFFQDFSYPVNIFPDKMKAKLNGQKLIPGKDFIVSPDSRGIKGNR